MQRYFRWVVSAGLIVVLSGAFSSVGEPADNTAKASLSLELKAGVRLEADGKPIDTDVGHAAPHVADIDGDGKLDLLVGQFGDGILWVYKNLGTNTSPRYAAGVKFKGGKEDGRVPTG